jgi:hypothetical protein
VKREDIKKFILKHLEKLTFAAATVVILVYLILLATTTSDAERIVVRADDAVKNLKECESKTGPPEIPSPEWFNHTKEQFGFVPRSESQINWFVFKLPLLIRTVKVEEQERIHLPPVNFTAEAGTYSVTLKWQPNPGNVGITIEKYTIKRLLSTDPLEKAVVVKELPPGETTFVDPGVQPDEKYKYWVEELAKEDASDAKPLKEQDKSLSSEVREVVTNCDIDIDVTTFIPQPPTSGKVKVTFTKLDSTTVIDPGVWVEKGKEIVLYPDDDKKRTNTGWVVKDLGERQVGPGKWRRFIAIRNAQGTKEKTFPPDLENPPGAP